jgi:hypothetical protein
MNETNTTAPVTPSPANQAAPMPPVPALLTPEEFKRRRPAHYDVGVPDLGTLRFHRLPIDQMIRIQSEIDDATHGGEVETGEVREVLLDGIATSLQGEWDTDAGREILNGLSDNEVVVLTRIVNAVGGIGKPIPTGADPWKWSVELGQSEKQETAVEAAKNE